jgi:filamentous hemagglutinin family protein
MKRQGATSSKPAHKHGFFRIAVILSAIGLPGTWFSLCLAQVPPITPSGLNTQVSVPNNLPSGKVQYDITGGTRPGGGANLFHSFGNFNVPNNNVANFLNDSGLPTTNILGRVTGGNISNIFGMIQTTNFGNANLFLMNPAGFLFGPNATLNVGGMVAFTSADYLRLQGGANDIFYADPAKPSILTSAPVAAYGFLGSNPGAITVQGSQLAVAPGQSISWVGGDITIQSGTLDNGTVQPARLSAPNGGINLATAASPGEFLWESIQSGGFVQFPTPFGPSNEFIPQSLTGPNVSGASFTSFGSVHLSPGSTVDTSQTGMSKVSIIGGQFLVDIQNASLTTASTPPASAGKDNVLLRGGSSIFTATSSTDHGPDVQIVADNIQVFGSFAQPPTPSIGLAINTITEGSGTAGNISLTASGNLDSATAQIVSSSVGEAPGTAGNVALTSTQGNISLRNFTLLSSAGLPDTLTLKAPHGDILLDMSQVNTQIFSPRVLGVNGGGIQVTANNLTLSNSQNIVPSSIDGINGANPQVPGNIVLTLSGNLNMSGGSQITTVSRSLAAGAADVNITAHDVNITGTGNNFGNPAVIHTKISTESQNAGHGGELNIVADNLQVTNGGQLNSGSVIGLIASGPPPCPFCPPPFQIVFPTGPGGTINIQGHSGPATSVLIDGAGSGIFTNSQGSGPGGNTNITAQSLNIQNGGVVSAQANGSGSGGLVHISADNLQLLNGGQITSGSVQGVVGGQNPLTGQPLPLPSGAGGQITIQGLTAAAGTVLIDGAQSGIFTNTVATGAAGNTNISAQSLTIHNGGTISAGTSGTAPSATGGSINITTSNGVTMNSGGSITSSSTGPANAGSIFINAGPELQMQNSSIKTEAAQAGGGNIEVQAVNLVQLGNSTISTSVLGGGGSGGNITIDPNAVVLQNSQILAQAVQGSGGNINITTNLLLPDTASIISASSQFGQQGNIVIQSPISPASGKIVPLSQRPLIATTLLGQRCAALAGGNVSSFTMAGREALPAEPGSWMPSPLSFSIVESQDGTAREARASSVASETEETAPLVSLRKIAPSGFLTQSFALSTDCAS